MKSVHLLALGLFMGMAAAAGAEAVQTAPVRVDPRAKFGFTFFRGNGERGVYLATSVDGLNWKEENGGKPVLPAVLDDRITRDPSTCLGPDGKYHMTFTTSWKHRGFGVAHSEDLIHWTKPEFVPINEDWPTAANTWAPEIQWRETEQRYVVIYATADAADRMNPKHHRQYYTTTTDFKSWTPRTLFLDTGEGTIDSFPVCFKGRNLVISRREKDLRVVWSKDGFYGPWDVPAARLDEDKCWGEGPGVIQLDDGRWVVYFDCTWNGFYGSKVTTDFRTFTPIAVKLPKGIRHGTPFRLKARKAR